MSGTRIADVRYSVAGRWDARCICPCLARRDDRPADRSARAVAGLFPSGTCDSCSALPSSRSFADVHRLNR